MTPLSSRKRHLKTACSVTAMAMACCLLTACPNPSSTPVDSRNTDKASMDPGILKLAPGQTAKVNLTITPASLRPRYALVKPERPSTPTIPASPTIRIEIVTRGDYAGELYVDVDPATSAGLYRFIIAFGSPLPIEERELKILVLPTDATPTAGRAADFASGDAHTVALHEDGSVWTWGQNDYGQLGDGSFTDRMVPVRVEGLPGPVQAVAAGGRHSLALLGDGTVWGWGDNRESQVQPDYEFEAYTVPVRVRLEVGAQPLVATAIAAGDRHSVLLATSRQVSVWGSNDYGQFGLSPNPAPNPLWKRLWTSRMVIDVQAIAAAGDHVLALGTDNTVFGWGRTKNGQLGVGYRDPYTTQPIEVPWLPAVAGISAGLHHSLFILADGTLGGIGANSSSQLGDGSLSSPAQLAMSLRMTNVTQAAAGWIHSLALQADGTVHAWGDNKFWQASRAANATANQAGRVLQLVPQRVTGLPSSRKIAAGGRHSLSLDERNRGIYTWGDNALGQLGDGALLTTRADPAPAYGFGDVDCRKVMTAFSQGPGRITVTSQAGTAIDDADCSIPRVTVFDRDTVVTLTARETDGSRFIGWSGNCAGTNPTIQVTMDRSRNRLTRFNLPPTALFTMDRKTIDVSSQVGATFKAGSSFDVDGRIVRYQWDFDGDGSFDDEGVEVEHRPSAVGTASILLRVTDEHGLTAEVTGQLEVTGSGGGGSTLIADFNHNPEEPLVNTSAHFDASGSSAGNQTITTYEWDFESDGTIDATGVTADHTFTATGTYSVTLRITNDIGQVATTSATLLVSQG